MVYDVVKISELLESVDFANLFTIGTLDDGQGGVVSKKVSLANLLKVISSVSITESEEDGGENTVVFHLLNGTDYTLHVKNGTKGSPGDGPNIFVARYNETGLADILAAVDAGKAVLAIKDGCVFQLSALSYDPVEPEYAHANFTSLDRSPSASPQSASLYVDESGWQEGLPEGLVVDDGTVLRQDDIANNVTTTGEGKVLDARQGKLLNDRINNLQSIGRFLALWDCTTGLPETNPSGYPYEYHTGDYFRVSQVGATNYKPDGASYEGTASTTVTTEDVQTGDIWFYDGTSWNLQVNHIGGTVQDVKVNGVSVVSGGVANIQKEVFEAEYGVTTFSDIRSAYNSGKIVIIKRSQWGYDFKGYLYVSTNQWADFIAFLGEASLQAYLQIHVTSANVWTTNQVNLERPTNKVTSLSSASTDTQYPSAKAVYDFVNASKNGVLLHEYVSNEPIVNPISYDSGTGLFLASAEELALMPSSLQVHLVLKTSVDAGNVGSYPQPTYNNIKFDKVDETHFSLSECTIPNTVNVNLWAISGGEMSFDILSYASGYDIVRIEVLNNARILNYSNRVGFSISRFPGNDGLASCPAIAKYPGYDKCLLAEGYIDIDVRNNGCRVDRMHTNHVYISSNNFKAIITDGLALGANDTSRHYFWCNRYSNGTRIRIYGIKL